MKAKLISLFKLISVFSLMLISLLSLSACKSPRGQEVLKYGQVEVSYTNYMNETEIYINIRNKNICRINHIKIDLEIVCLNQKPIKYTIDEDVIVDGYFSYNSQKLITNKDAGDVIQGIRVKEIVLKRSSFIAGYTNYLVVIGALFIIALLLTAISYKKSIRLRRSSFKSNKVINILLLIAIVLLTITKYKGYTIPLFIGIVINSIFILVFNKKANKKIKRLNAIKESFKNENNWQAEPQMAYKASEARQEVIMKPAPVVARNDLIRVVSISNRNSSIYCSSMDTQVSNANSLFKEDYNKLVTKVNSRVHEGMKLYATPFRFIKKLYELEPKASELLTIRIDMKKLLSFASEDQNYILDAMDNQIRLSRRTLIIISELKDYYNDEAIDSLASEVINRILMLKLEINANDDKKLDVIGYIVEKE